MTEILLAGEWTPQEAADYVSDSWRNAVESIIETGRRLIEAKEKVRGRWLAAVELMPFGIRTAQYLMGVSEHPVLSDAKYTSHLPASWMTLATLAQLPADEATALIGKGAITSELTQAEAKTLVSASKGSIEPGAHVGANSGDNEWYTPEEYIAAAVRVMGGIDLDPASSPTANDNIGAAAFYTAQDDGLKQPWHGRLWMNPPYAQPLIQHFAERMAEQYLEGNVTSAIVLVNNGTETGWFQTLANVACALCFPKGRIKFWHPDKVAVPLQGQAFFYLGPDPQAFAREFSAFGFVVGTV